MSLHRDWYIYHSRDDLHWVLQEGGPYSDEESKAALKEDEARHQDIELRIARIAYPQGALPDKRIERAALDQTAANKAVS
jgi:hypothetical protein